MRWLKGEETADNNWFFGPPLQGIYDPPITLHPEGANWPDLTVVPDAQQTVRVKVSKDSHKIEFTDESEHEVTVVIGPKEK